MHNSVVIHVVLVWFVLLYTYILAILLVFCSRLSVKLSFDSLEREPVNLLGS